MYTGSCLCGGVRFRIHAELSPNVASKASWWSIHDALPQHAEGLPPATHP